MTTSSVIQACRTELQWLVHAQAERRQQAAIILSTLEGLWDLLDMADDDMDRKKFQTMLNGPSCVHATVLDNVRFGIILRYTGNERCIMHMHDMGRRPASACSDCMC